MPQHSINNAQNILLVNYAKKILLYEKKKIHKASKMVASLLLSTKHQVKQSGQLAYKQAAHQYFFFSHDGNFYLPEGTGADNSCSPRR